jgi:hypothetical protein
VSVLDVLDRLNDLLDAGQLLQALGVAVEHLGVEPSSALLDYEALLVVLEAAVNRAVLDEHYREHPSARPTDEEVAHATVEQSG